MFDLIDTAITGEQFLLALHDTLIMVAVSLGFGALIGVPLGIVLVVCRPGGIVALVSGSRRRNSSVPR